MQEIKSNKPVFRLSIKRAIDVIVSFCAIAVIWPILLIIIICIKISSPGPVFYRGLRTGLNWKEFYILKFRSMVENAEQKGGPTTGSNDPRVTGIGKILRKTKLDELPQFFNVLKGDMSLVGPRPEVIKYTSMYEGEEKLIVTMRPGITDYASVEFADLDDRVGSEDPDAYFREHILPVKNKLRVKYVKEWSLMADFKILWNTALRVVKRVVKR